MKNIIYLIVMTAFILTACSKDSMPKGLQSGVATYSMDISPSPHNYYKQELALTAVTYTVDNGRIVLDNAEDFKIFMWGLESKDIDDWKNSIDFESYGIQEAINQSDNLDESIALFAALNPKGIIQIEPYIFKFNIEEEKILVIESSTENALEEIQLAYAPTSLIKEFSFEDDIWYLLENDILPEEDLSEVTFEDGTGKRCNEKRARSFVLREETIPCDGDLYNWNQLTGVLRYRRLGIWEICRATVYNNKYNLFTQSNEDLTDFYLFGGIINYDFDERCGPAYQGVYNIPAMTTDLFQILLRSDKKPLARGKNTVSMSVVFKYLCAPDDPLLQHTMSKTNF